MWMHLLLLSSLTGIILDEKNQPIEGAVVVLNPSSFREEPVTAISDAEGRFRIPVERSGPIRVEAYAPGYAPFRVRDVDAGKPLSIVLRRGGETLTGVVRDGTTLDPLPGAIVETRTGSWVPAAPRLGVVEAVSDEKGAFRLEGLGKAPYSVSASAPGYGRARVHDVAPGEAVELYLFPGSGVYGRLLDEKGNPVEGAFVSVEMEDRTRRSAPSSAQQSDSEGRFAFLGLEPGRYRLFARGDGYAPAVHDLELVKETDAEVELALTAGVTLTGRLIDENDEAVVGKVSLRALDGGPVGSLLRSGFTAETDSEGRFSLASIPAGDHTLVVEARGYGSKDVAAPVSGRNRQEDLGDVVLETGLAITGKVLAESGAPIEGASVHAFPSFRSAMDAVRDRIYDAETDGEGRFVLAGLSQGNYNLMVEAAGFGRSELVVRESGTTDIAITLKPSGSIRGIAIDPEGHPVASLRVVALSSERESFGGLGGVEENGVFVIEGVAEGEYALEISSTDFRPESISSVRVTAGNATDVGTIRLRRGGRIEGTVVNGSEEPVPGAAVRAIPRGFRPYDLGGDPVSTDRAGRFLLGGLADGKVDLLAAHPSYAETRVEGVEVDSASEASEVRLVLRSGGSIEGYVRGRDPADIAGRMIRASSSASERLWDSPGAQTSADGYFRIEHLPAGSATVALVQNEGNRMFAVQSRNVEVREGETTYVEFVSKRILVQGQARRGGTPLSGAAIALAAANAMGMSASFGSRERAPSTGPRYLAAVAGEDGYYELLVDEPGEYRLSASANGLGLPSRTVAIPDVESYALDLDFGGAAVSGRIVDKETEAPVAGAFVTARSSNPSSASRGTGLQAGPDGSFELALEPGEFTIVVQADGYGTAEQKVAVADGERSDLLFALSRGLRIAGRVVDASGRGVGSLRVMAVEDTTDVSVPPLKMGFAMTIPDGTFGLKDLARGRYNVLASGGAGFAFLASAPSGTDDHVLVLRPGGRVEVLVVDPEGKPVGNAIVAVAAIDGRKVRGIQGQADGSGRLELEAPQGNLTIKAAVMNGPEGMATVAVSENATARIRVTVAQAASTAKK